MSELPPIVEAPDSMVFPERFVEVSEESLFRVLDTGIPHRTTCGTLVLLHSAVGSLKTFKYQFSDFFAAGYRVVAYDRRGHGKTKPHPAGMDKIPAQQDLLDLLDAIGITEPVHLLGAAAGGRLAADFAMMLPHRVASLTLVCSLAGVATELYPQGTASLLPPEFLALPAYLRELGPVYRGDNPHGTAEWRNLVEKDTPKKLVSNPAAWKSKQPPTATANSSSAPPPGGISGLKWLSQPEASRRQGLPIHLITGDADPYATSSAYGRLSQELPRAAFDIVTGAGHSPYWEQPHIFNAMVLQQLNVATTQGVPA